MLRSKRRLKGQALVEFALVFPIIVLLLLAMFDAGRAVFIYNGLTNAAREGVRLAIVNQDKDKVLERVTSDDIRWPGVKPGCRQPGRVLPAGPRWRAWRLRAPLSRSGASHVVTPMSDWSLITPVLSGIIGPITFEARSELPIELVCPDADVAQYATSAGCPRQP